MDKLGVPYALIGGLAVAARGAFRATKDVDLLVDWPLQEAASLAHSLSANGLPATFYRGAADDPLAGVIRLVVPTSAATIKCDILFPSRTWQEEAVRRATKVDLGGFTVPVVQADDLFLLKLHAGGPMDLFDAAHLLELQNEAGRGVWRERAAKVGESKAFKKCMNFLRGGE